MLCGISFIAGLSFDPVPDAHTEQFRDPSWPDAVRESHPRITKIADWDDSSALLPVFFSEEIVTWMGRANEGASACAAFDNGDQLWLACEPETPDSYPHEFTWVNVFGSEPGTVRIVASRDGRIDASYTPVEEAADESRPSRLG